MDTNVTVALIGVLGTLITSVATIVATLLTREQRRQKQDIDALAFIVSHFLPHWELEHLRNLAAERPFQFDGIMFPNFPGEVRELRDRGLIIPKNSNFHMSDLPARGPDLRDYFDISADGKTYLDLLKQIRGKE